MTSESAKETAKGASSSLFSRIIVAITLLLLAGVFMALGACSTTENKVSFTAGGPTSPAASSGDGIVMLSWSAVTGASSYKIYWNTTGGVSAADASISEAGTTYTHTGLTNGRRYYYRISAVTGGGTESPMSDETSAMPVQPRPSTPAGLTATTSTMQVTLMWQAAAHASSYKLYWNTTGGVTSSDQHIAVNGLTYTHTELTNGTAYHYRVSAVNDSGESDLSAEVSATPGGGGGGGGAGNAYYSGEWYEFPTGGKADWSSGVVTFSITGLEFGMLPAGKDYFLFMAKLVTPSGREGNFQINLADLSTRLISQRFDVACPGRTFCEQQDIGGVNWLIGEVYSIRIEWNTSTVRCDITDSGGANVFTGVVNTWGAYTGVSFVRVGNGVLPPYPGINYPITVIAPALQ